jgi:hypothetical protein
MKYLGESIIKYTQKIVWAIKYWGLHVKGLTNRWFYEDNIIILGYVIFKLLFAWTSKIKLLQSCFFTLLASIWFLKNTSQYWCGEHSNIIFLG